MILTNLNKCIRYANLIPNLTDILSQIDEIEEYVEGRYETEYGFCMIQKGTTKHISEGYYETHERYIDIQVMLKGSEELYYADRDELIITSEYEEEKDMTLHQGNGLRFKIDANMCYIMFKEDAHMTCVHSIDKQDYLKLVYKVRI